jgi:hypothetical protein
VAGSAARGVRSGTSIDRSESRSREEVECAEQRENQEKKRETKREENAPLAVGSIPVTPVRSKTSILTRSARGTLRSICRCRCTLSCWYVLSAVPKKTNESIVNTCRRPRDERRRDERVRRADEAAAETTTRQRGDECERREGARCEEADAEVTRERVARRKSEENEGEQRRRARRAVSLRSLTHLEPRRDDGEVPLVLVGAQRGRAALIAELDRVALRRVHEREDELERREHDAEREDEEQAGQHRLDLGRQRLEDEELPHDVHEEDGPHNREARARHPVARLPEVLEEGTKRVRGSE